MYFESVFSFKVGLNKENDDKLPDSTYIPNSLWDLEEISTEVIISSDRYFDNIHEIRNADASINIVLKRRPLYFMVNNIFPCMILNCITVLAFSLPFAQQIALSKHNFISHNPLTY